jgi:sortase A
MRKTLLFKIAALVSGLIGIFILAATFYPILEYELLSRDKYPELLSPMPKGPSFNLGSYDTTKASNWFPKASKKSAFAIPAVAYYTLSVPKLEIENATVAIGGEDLAENLIQYPGTALPGNNGNAVIFGHSILPRFYNPKDYISIFSLLPTLEKGDEIGINYDGISYSYIVEDMFEVRPTDIQVLEQDPTDAFVTLVTCTPPGDPRKPKRLIVRARINNTNKAYVNTGY